MGLFRAYGLTLGSDLDFPELPPARSRPDLRLRLWAAGPVPRAGRGWTPLSFEDRRRPWAAVRRANGALRLRLPGLAEFRLAASGREIACAPAPRVPPETVRHLVLDLVLPCLLARAGRTVLHGSCVRVGGGAVVFAGDTGCGKSTLAAAFARKGFALLADDAVVVDEPRGAPRVRPAYPGIRLWPDAAARLAPGRARRRVAHYTAKVRVAAGDAGFGFSPRPAPLRRVYLLPDPGERPRTGVVAVEPVPPAEATAALAFRSFWPHPGDRAWVRCQFETLAGCALLSRVRRLAYPPGMESLRSVVRAVLRDAAAG